MFLKPFKIKTNHQLKATDKKHLKEEFKKAFPRLTDETLNELFSKKENISCMKIETAANGIIQIYIVNKRPMAFVCGEKLLPTVYFLWKCPEIMLTFTTHAAVLAKLTDGADLMLPGVAYPKFSSCFGDTPAFSANTPVCINLTSNKAVVAVGVTAESSDYFIKSQNRGKCVLIYHFINDKLCTLENMQCLPVPKQGCPDWISKALAFTDINNGVAEDQDDDESSRSKNSSPTVTHDSGESSDEETTTELNVKEMDELFLHCFLAAIKYTDGLSTPVLTSTFYLYMKRMCPPHKTLDIKKSSCKKLSQFLERMAELGIIELEEEKKGVLAITKIDRKNAKVAEFVLDPADCPSNPSKEQNDTALSIIECDCVTAPVLGVFEAFGFTKGSVVMNSEIQKYIREYVKRKNLQDDNRVRINEALRPICPRETSTTWPILIQNVNKAMSPCYKLTCGDNEIIRKGKLQPINITVAKRCGRKTVTLVDNVETFGINIDELASNCQHGVAASISINRSQTVKKTDQLQIQGNQVLFIYNILMEKYKVPKKYVNGLQYAPKQKN